MDTGTTNNPNTNQNTGPAPDAGSRKAAIIAWIVGILAFLGVVSIQQGLVGGEPESKPSTQLLAPDDSDPEVVSAKIYVRLRTAFNDQDNAAGKAFLPYAEAASKHPIDQFHNLILRAELGDTDASIADLKKLDLAAKDDQGRAPLSGADSAALAEQRDAAVAVLEHDANAITQQQREALTSSHGYFGRLLLSHSLPDTDPARAPLVDGGERILIVISLAGLVIVTYAILGLVMMILFFVRVGKGRVTRAFTPPAPGGSVYIETVALFLFCFIALQAAVHLLPGSLEPSLPVKMLLQWTFLLVPLWPLFRGVSFQQLRSQLGLVAPKGLTHEIGVGIYSYFAALPFLAVAFVITIILIYIQRFVFGNFEPPRNPIQDVVNKASPWTLVMFFMLATMWAPLVEETMFRGALFRHLRGRRGVAFSAIASGLVFGFMHGYAPPLLLPVITLGIIFALMREWRGSLVASMTAHFIHNFTLLTISIAFVEAMK